MWSSGAASKFSTDTLRIAVLEFILIPVTAGWLIRDSARLPIGVMPPGMKSIAWARLAVSWGAELIGCRYEMYGDIGGGCVGDVLVLAFLGGDPIIDGVGWKRDGGEFGVCAYGMSGLDEWPGGL